MTQITDKVFAESLPPGNYGEGLIVEVDGKYYLNLIDDEGVMLVGTKPLPPGTWRFLFTTNTATEEDARKVVGWFEIGGKISYYDYLNPEPYRYLIRWEDSLHSLLRSKGLDDKNYALIEKL